MDGNWFHIFLCLYCNDTIFKRFFTRSKTERKLNCSRALRRCRKIYETGNIQPVIWSGLKIGPTREEASRNSAPNDQWTPRVPDTEVQLLFYIRVWHYESSQAGHTGSSFYVPGVPSICTWRSGCSICTYGVPCCSSISPLFYFL